MPNILAAEYWLRKADLEEKKGDLKAALDTLQEAMRRDVRPASAIVKAYNELKERMEAPVEVPVIREPALGSDDAQEEATNVEVKAVGTPSSASPAKTEPRRKSQVRFCTPDANVLIPAATPAPAQALNSCHAGSTPFHSGLGKAQQEFGRTTEGDSISGQDVMGMDMTSLSNALEEVSPNTLAEGLCHDILEATIAEMAVPDAPPKTPQVTKGAPEAGAAAAGDDTSPEVHVQINPMFNLTPSPVSADAPPPEACYTPAAQPAPPPLHRLPTPIGIPALFSTFAARAHLFSPGGPPPPSRSRLAMASGPAMGRNAAAVPGNEPAPVPHATPLEATPTKTKVASDALPPFMERPIVSPFKLVGDNVEMPCGLDLSPGSLDALPAIRTRVTPTAFGSPLGSVASPLTPATHHASPTHPPPLPAITPLDPALSLGSATSAATTHNVTPSTAPLTSASRAVHARARYGSESHPTGTPMSFTEDQPTEQWTGGSQSEEGTPEAEECAPESGTPAVGGHAGAGITAYENEAKPGRTPGRAMRVCTPASRAAHRVGDNEVRSILEGVVAPEDLAHMGSCVRLSPVRAPSKLRDALGSGMVVTPVRRSARKSHAPTPVASLLRQTQYSYAPNAALEPQLPAACVFDCPPPPPPTPAGAAPAACPDSSSMSVASKAGSKDADHITSLTAKLSAVSIADMPTASKPVYADSTAASIAGVAANKHQVGKLGGHAEGAPVELPLQQADGRLNQAPLANPSAGAKAKRGSRQQRQKEDMKLSPTEARIRDGLRRSSQEGLRRSSRLRASSVDQ